MRPALRRTRWARLRRTARRLTSIANPVPQLGDLMTKQTVTYTRKDGIKCVGSLYLPKGYDKERDGRLPVFLWTYPYEYKCAADCVKDHPDRYKFTKPGYGNAFIWASQGYAVFDMLYETGSWLDRFVRDAEPRPQKPEEGAGKDVGERP